MPDIDLLSIDTQPIRLQPVPLRTLVGEIDHITSVTRVWTSGDHHRCRLCTRCDAIDLGRGMAVCQVITEEPVSDGAAPLYSSCELDFGDGTGRERRPLGRTAV